MLTKLEYLLTCVGEEGAEIAVRASKALRFGLYEQEPGQDETNVQRLNREINDLLATFAMLADEINANYPPPTPDDWLDLPDDALIEAKQRKLEKYMRYSRECGRLEPEQAGSHS
jgi:hypothetical protein